MEKIKVALKALQLEQTLFDQWPDIEPRCYAADLRELIENGEEQILLMFDWVQMGTPELPLKAFRKTDGDKGTLIGLDPAYFDQLKADNQQMDTTALWLVCLLLARIIAVICTPITLLGETLYKACHTPPKVDLELSPMLYWLVQVGKERRSEKQSHKYTSLVLLILCSFLLVLLYPFFAAYGYAEFRSEWKLYLRYRFSHSNSSISLFYILKETRDSLHAELYDTKGKHSSKTPPKAHPKTTPKDEQTAIDYHYVWWNAWLYSGSDNLWAGLIKALHEAIEQRYGAPYVCRSKSHEL
eukprot:scaffold51947_cov63-Phaeocystis_antarctica.AAC.2